MLRVGLTGGLASGKSTVAKFLAELGASVFDADQIVADLYRPGGEGLRIASELFGDEVLDPKGGVDRLKIAQIVFRDPSRRHDLEARIHPLVRGEIERRFTAAEAEGFRVAVVEASQLLEAGTEKSDCDRILLVTAPVEERVRRWGAGGGDAEDARRRIAAQLPPEIASRRAHDVLANDGTLEDLRRKTEALYRSWLGEDSTRH